MNSFSEQDLRALVQRIIASGELGRSRTYGAILSYLMECSIAGEQPKEMAIAVDVLGRESDFDVGKDSIVRVHLYHLRNKLESYYRRHGSQEAWRLEIPKGQYLLTVVPNTAERQLGPAEPETDRGHYRKSRPDWRRAAMPLLVAVLAVLLTVSLLYGGSGDASPAARAAQLKPWQNILDDDTPILVVVGDYYIFGELDAQGNVARMVRDFSINSSEDLNNLYLIEPELYERYYDLGLAYLPVGTAPAMAQVMPLLANEGDRINVKTMSQLTAADLAGSHIIYLGYISALGRMEELVFAASGLRVGTTYDELLTEDGQRFASTAGQRMRQPEFRDYALFSSFVSPRGQQFVVIAGMRDEGLIRLAREVATPDGLALVASALEDAGISDENSELLYEVVGMDATSFDARPVYTGELDARRIWGGEN